MASLAVKYRPQTLDEVIFIIPPNNIVWYNQGVDYMYGYVYETENLVNHKKYIGKKASPIFLPEYHGSGTILLEAVAKYGEHNFKTHILEWCESLEQLNEKERYYIRINDAVNSSNYYNI